MVAPPSEVLREGRSRSPRTEKAVARRSRDAPQAKLPVTEQPLSPPPLPEIADALDSWLRTAYDEVSVSVVDAPPDLTEEPYNLLRPGLGGNPHLIDIGGNDNLFPKVDLSKEYSVSRIIKDLGLGRVQAFGPGAPGYSQVQQNAELVCKMDLGCTGWDCRSKVGIVEGDVDGPQDQRGIKSIDYEGHEVSSLCQLFVSSGEVCPAIRVHLRGRKEAEGRKGDLLAEMQEGLARAFAEPISLGGVFTMPNGTAKCHVMSDFTPEPIRSQQYINEKWLRYFYEEKMTFVAVCTSKDFDGDAALDMRMLHAHGVTPDGRWCGHYHHDTTPETVEYEGFFLPAVKYVRVDQCSHTPDFAKDWSNRRTTGPKPGNTPPTMDDSA